MWIFAENFFDLTLDPFFKIFFQKFSSLISVLNRIVPKYQKAGSVDLERLVSIWSQRRREWLIFDTCSWYLFLIPSKASEMDMERMLKNFTFQTLVQLWIEFSFCKVLELILIIILFPKPYFAFWDTKSHSELLNSEFLFLYLNSSPFRYIWTIQSSEKFPSDSFDQFLPKSKLIDSRFFLCRNSIWIINYWQSLWIKKSLRTVLEQNSYRTEKLRNRRKKIWGRRTFLRVSKVDERIG